MGDRFGVPHIFAPDHASLFRAYGYAQMEAHSELLLSLYAQAQGRGAEFYYNRHEFGSHGTDVVVGTALLEADRWVRTNGVPATARQWAAGQSAEFGPLIEAFASGVNEWAAEHPEELSVEAAAVLAALGGIAPEHVYAHCLRVIHYDWIVSPSRLQARLNAAKVDVHGSNEWAVGPSRSASGGAMLLSNSHLQWGDRHLLRSPSQRSRSKLQWRGVGRVSRAAAVLQQRAGLDSDHEVSAAAPLRLPSILRTTREASKQAAA